MRQTEVRSDSYLRREPGVAPPRGAARWASGFGHTVRSAALGLVASGALVVTLRSTGCIDEAAARDAHTPRRLARFDAALAQTALGSDALETRLAALERLGAQGTQKSLLLLLEALQGARGTSAAEVRLTAVRALAPHASNPSVWRALLRLASSGAPASGRSSALDAWAQHSAALAVARSGDPAAQHGLLRLLASEGPGAQAAAMALLAVPPTRARDLVQAVSSGSLLAVQTAALLGDQRSFSALRWLVRRGPESVRGPAAVALTRLGHLETVELARHWSLHSGSERELLAAAEILLLARDAAAPALLGKLLRAPSTRAEALRLVLASPMPALAPALAALLDQRAGAGAADAPERAALLGALGRCGGGGAVLALRRTLARGEDLSAATYALAQMPGDDALEALGAVLRSPRLQRWGLRGALVRWVTFEERVEGAAAVAERLLGSTQDADRTAAAALQAAEHASRTRELLRSGDLATLIGAASVAALHGDAALIEAAQQLSTATGARRDALAIALLSARAADALSTETLLALIDDAAAAAPLAGRALAARGDAEEHQAVGALLGSDDPLMRAQVALGLGAIRGEDPSGLLARAYRFEIEPLVRAAIVDALAAWPGPASRRCLHWAASLDAEPAVRSTARLALLGLTAATPSQGRQLVWLELVGTEPRRSPTGPLGPSPMESASLLLWSESSLALPVLPSADGVVVAAGLANGRFEHRVVLRP